MDSLTEFENLLGKTKDGKYTLSLYVVGSTPHSVRAIQNIKRICEEKLSGRYELTIIDLFQMPEAAQSGQVIAAPTLVKHLPPPLRRLIGDMTNTNKVLLALDITSADAVDL